MKEIEVLDCQYANGILEKNDRLKRLELIGLLTMTNKKIDSLISQKVIANWFKHGESFSRYFHFMLIWLILRNEVKGVMVGGL